MAAERVRLRRRSGKAWVPLLCETRGVPERPYDWQLARIGLCSHHYGLHMSLVLSTQLPRTLRPGHPSLRSSYPYSNAYTWWNYAVRE